MRIFHLVLLTAALLISSAMPAAAQTYFPFGSVVIGTTTAVATRVGPVGGHVSTADPTFTTGQVHPFSLTTSGRLRVDAGSITVEPGVAPLQVIINDTTAPVDVLVTNGSGTVTNDADIPRGTATIAEAAAVQYQDNGTTFVGVRADPCQVNAKLAFAINGTAGATLITGTASKKVYLCHLNLITGEALNLNIVSGTGTVCATGITAIPGLAGGTTAATGWKFTHTNGGGIVLGSGSHAIGYVQNNADNVCLLTSGSTQISGGGSYVVQ